ncbi:Speckle-type POZ protein like [Argiope bruennichi]|uniref:Speckle-type POZ protein like n=1 Tax=Argiope bruennichi TaxID=94029 RepID=A0A8T0EFL0_ARGBR|nr:Speckle-type POZ protein like [Argiope bruennichi]
MSRKSSFDEWDNEIRFDSRCEKWKCELEPQPIEPQEKIKDFSNELISEHDRVEFFPGHEKKELDDCMREEFNIDREKKNIDIEQKPTEHKKKEDQYSDSDKIDFFIVTKIPKDTKHFLWTINQFSSLPDVKELLSPGIYRLCSAWCRLKLVKKDNGFSLYFVKSGQSTQKTLPVTGFHNTFSIAPSATETEGVSHETVFPSKLEFNISATDYKGKVLTNWLVTFSDSNEATCKTIGEYITNDQITLPKDILILDCRMTITIPPVSEKRSFKPSDKLVCQSWIKLSADLKCMYQNSLNTDVTLIAGSDEIRVNKSILSARSPVFKKMFQHDTKENEHNSIEITNVSSKSLKTLVEFLYSGNLEVNEKNFSLQDLLDLYFTANKYEAMDLRSICAKLLLLRVTVDNVSVIFTWADDCNDKELKSQLINFISANFEAIVDADAWSSFVANQTKLAAEIVKVCFKTLKKSGLIQ